ncbi:TRAP transporter substrate-binding protein [Arthrobacter gengyunqii]|uniref:TRAP transporter substrate-binding protein n=1 Tax=Arthrobacter gengyunqii TaxID=2886940 RepID=A0A9X1S6K0_9MICC|nr:TRAP transporter substrate-binding protein [Arthrobacter gengyunqii]MCC3269171.1 TRAP transporter substrate-binding protein [Arthrobacter gengyunqii]UOY94869.1 TRAP transporter substrate-binding protein [Arthrobacter gengyunqii]
MRSRKTLATAALCVPLLGLTACAGAAGTASDTTELKIAHVWPESSPVNDAAKSISKSISASTDGSLTAKVFPAGQLGGDVELNEGLVNGTLDCALVNHTTAGIDPRLGVGFLPYIVDSFEDADKVFYGDGLIAHQNREVLEEHGVVALEFFENGFRSISNDEKAVSSPGDLQGLKIRLPEIAVLLDTFKNWGAQPLAMPLPELYTALQQGTVDGQDNGVVLTADSKFQEVQDHVSITNHVYGAGVIACSKGTWDKLTPEEQTALKQAAEEASLEQREASRGDIASSIKELEDAGVEVTELTAEQMDAFRTDSMNIWNDYSDTFGTELIEELRAVSEDENG